MVAASHQRRTQHKYIGHAVRNVGVTAKATATVAANTELDKFLSIEPFAQRSRNFHSIIGCDSNQSRKLQSLRKNPNKQIQQSFLPPLSKFVDTFSADCSARLCAVE